MTIIGEQTHQSSESGGVRAPGTWRKRTAFIKPLAIICLAAVLVAAPWLTADVAALAAMKPQAGDPVFLLASASSTTTKATTKATTRATTAAATTAVATATPTRAATATTAAPTTASAATSAPAGTAPTPAAGQTTFLDQAASGSLVINAKAYALYEVESGTFLFGRSPDTPLSPASITKVMTVLLALEKLQPADTITITKDMYATIPNDYVRLGLTEGEVITVEQALYACMLISSNDTAMALGFKMGGSLAGFTAMMNEKAKALGCTGTTFTNPYGLAEATNLTTAHDMALIMAEALKNPTFTKMATTKQLLLPATNKAGTRGLSNGNRFISTAKYAYAPYVGGKTGFTNMSGHTIVAGARKDGRTLVGVILGATASEIRYANLITLFDYGFANYGTTKLDPAGYDGAKAQAIAQVESTIRDGKLRLAVAGASVTLNGAVTAAKARSAGGFNYVIGDPATPMQAALVTLANQPVSNPQSNQGTSGTQGTSATPGATVTQVAQSGQSIDFPLLIEYKDGNRSRVGTLSVALKQLQPTATPSNTPVSATTAGGTAAAAANPGTGQGSSLLLRIIGIALIVVVLAAIVVLFLMWREANRRKRRRGSGPRRL